MSIGKGTCVTVKACQCLINYFVLEEIDARLNALWWRELWGFNDLNLHLSYMFIISLTRSVPDFEIIVATTRLSACCITIRRAIDTKNQTTKTRLFDNQSINESRTT